MSRRKTILIVWLISDLVIFVGSYALAYFSRVGWIFSTDFPFWQFIIVAVLVSPVWVVSLIATRTFALFRKQLDARTLMYIVFCCVMGTSLFALTYYFLYGLFFSRLLLLFALIYSIVNTWLWHLLFGAISRSVMRKDPPAFPTLIIGATREAAALIRSLNENQSPLMPVAILDSRGVKELKIEGVIVEGKLNKLEDTLKKYNITHLIQCSDLEQSMNLLSACRANRISYMLMPSVLGIVEQDERIDVVEGRPMTTVRPEEPTWTWFFS
jgi:FlaA1/EpsC-like NDP-sugar epimerase